MRDRRGNGLLILWVISVAAALGTGWLVFGLRSRGLSYHAVFLISVGAAVLFSILLLWRGLSGPGR